jgi:arylsulfatase A-like enzyme
MSHFSEPLRPARQNSPGALERAARQRRRYAEEISGMDASLGQLFDLLEANRILDEAIVVVTSDHGEHLYDAPGGMPYSHGWTVYEPETLAVCLVRLPRGRGGGTRVTTPTSHIDLFPTLLNYLHLPLPRAVDGVAFELPGPPVTSVSRTLFCEATKPWEGVETDRRWYNLRKPRAALRDGQKFIQTLYRGTEELYDLGSDPGERDNLLLHPRPEDAAAAQELRTALNAWAASARPLPTNFEKSERRDTIMKLKALGYL